ncbi:hypothetical protein [Actinomycetospora flava]|uniref:Response regulatory domain-containing protein n=1 Tax=Actinomycetospora flava TaxID=3129232 RepID=A0ABU8M888_9PSEU
MAAGAPFVCPGWEPAAEESSSFVRMLRKLKRSVDRRRAVGGSDGLWQIVLGSVPTLVWAGVVVAALVLLRNPLRQLLPRLQSVSAAGVDVSFVAAGLDAAARQQEVPVDTGRRESATARAADNADLLQGSRLLWLDARPAHNRAERRVFRSLGMDVTAVTTLDEAVDLATRADPDVVITNYGKSPAEGMASVADQVGAAIGDLVPVIVYSRGVAGKPTPAHCFAQTDRPDDLLHLVIDALEHTAHDPYRQP